MVKNLPVQEMQVRALELGSSPGRGNATYSSILVWEIPWTEEPGRLQSVGLQRVRHISATECTHMPGSKW